MKVWLHFHNHPAMAFEESWSYEIISFLIENLVFICALFLCSHSFEAPVLKCVFLQRGCFFTAELCLLGFFIHQTRGDF